MTEQLNAPAGADLCATGVDGLDQVLAGGLPRNCLYLVQGDPGSGATQMASKDEPSVVFSFDETAGIALARAEKLGLDFPQFVSRGTINLQQVDPAEISPGEFADRIQRSVAEGCTLVVIDSLNGYLNAMPGERYLR